MNGRRERRSLLGSLTFVRNGNAQCETFTTVCSSGVLVEREKRNDRVRLCYVIIHGPSPIVGYDTAHRYRETRCQIKMFTRVALNGPVSINLSRDSYGRGTLT